MARHRPFEERTSILSRASVPWLPLLVGVGVMAGFLVYGVTLRVGGDEQFEVPVEAGHNFVPSPSVTATPEPSPPPAATPEPTLTPTPESPPPPPPETTKPPPPPTTEPPPDVVAKYRLLWSFDHSFIAKIVIVNKSDHDQDWKLKLVYPDNVGKLADFWIDGSEQPKASTVEDRHVLVSTVPVEADSFVVLYVKFIRSGEDVAPTVCKLNGTKCIL